MPISRPRTMITAAVALGAALATVGLQPAAAVDPDPSLKAELTQVLKDPRVQAAHTSVSVRAADGTQLFGRRVTRALTPASNTKLLTAAAAMSELGPGYRFHTRVISRGTIRGGVLHGNLYLKGYGDPTLRVADLWRLADSLQRQGITRIDGRLVADATWFDADRYNDSWSRDYFTDYYAAQVSALTMAPDDDLDAGTVILRYRPASTTGRKARVTVLPESAGAYVTVINKTTTVAGGYATVRAGRPHGSNRFTVTGSMVRGGKPYNQLITVDRPDLYAAAVFRRQLTRHGITVIGRTTAGATPAGQQKVLTEDRSVPLRELLVPFLKLSNNSHADALTKTMGREVRGTGSWAAGTAVIRSYLRSRQLPLDGLVLKDGSGLTRANKITPTLLTRLLVRVRHEPWFAAFRDALPVAGVSKRMVGGTLKDRMKGTRAAGNARAKTGSLTGVTALSGYVRGADGRLYVFSMISNYTASTPRPVEDELVTTLARHRVP